ncbi:MAG: hypothetical protein QXN15_06600 [Candidatus Jordarchaeales archaeon]
MRSLSEVIEVIRRHREELRERYGVKEMGFCSLVRGKSDVDILVEFEKPISSSIFSGWRITSAA